MNVPFVRLQPQNEALRAAILEETAGVLDRSSLIRGQRCEDFEEAFGAYLGGQEVIGCGNGLDALRLILGALGIGPGDEVIVPAHTFIATALAVTAVGAAPVFADIEPDYFSLSPSSLEAAITERTRAVIVVHLYGQAGRWEDLEAIARRAGLILIEDAAQAHGAEWDGKKAGTLGLAGAFSFYPTKNLGALGDAGAVVTGDPALAERVRMLGNYGSREKYHHELEGINSRLDELQAAFLFRKLPFLDEWNRSRRMAASRYLTEIQNPRIRLPAVNPRGTPVWHVFPVLCEKRDALAAHLADRGIGTLVHYPTPMHLHDAFSRFGGKIGDFPIAEQVCARELGLPMFAGITEAEVTAVIEAVNEF